jgi:hypothetical protein
MVPWGRQGVLLVAVRFDGGAQLEEKVEAVLDVLGNRTANAAGAPEKNGSARWNQTEV